VNHLEIINQIISLASLSLLESLDRSHTPIPTRFSSPPGFSRNQAISLLDSNIPRHAPCRAHRIYHRWTAWVSSRSTGWIDHKFYKSLSLALNPRLTTHPLPDSRWRPWWLASQIHQHRRSNALLHHIYKRQPIVIDPRSHLRRLQALPKERLDPRSRIVQLPTMVHMETGLDLVRIGSAKNLSAWPSQQDANRDSHPEAGPQKDSV
jgi:hypothetical protein